MLQQIKEDWIINNSNIFGLSKGVKLPIFIIQGEILNQLKGENINSISNYLKADIDLADKEINLASFKFFKQTLKDNFSHILRSDKIPCSMLLRNMQDFLLDEYYTKKNKNILRFSEYKSQYNEFLKDYLSTTIDTDEIDFIKAEIKNCDRLLLELEKPIYNQLTALDEVTDEPCLFKSNLANSIDKRKKFLNEKQKQLDPLVKVTTPPPIKDKKPESLSELITHPKRDEIYKAIRTNYKDIKGKQLLILFKALQKVNILPTTHGTKAKFRRGFEKEFGWEIGTISSMDEVNFNKNFTDPKGKYIITKDGRELANKVEFLQNIIKAN